MTQVNKSFIAVTAFACSAFLSFGWSEHGGISLSVESAQARVGRPLTPVSVAGVARRQTRRAYGYGVAGAAVGAAAVGAAAVAAGSYCGGPYRTGYYGGGPYAAYGTYGAPVDWAALQGIKCQP